jgi:hypothetical protein
MNPPLRHCATFLLAGLVGLAFTGCATMRPLTTKPTMSKVVLTDPYPVHHRFTRIILPAGTYRPLYEDDKFFYYQAPAKVVVNRFFSKMFDGGVYVKRGDTALRGWYYVEEDGSQNFGKFETEPPHR